MTATAAGKRPKKLTPENGPDLKERLRRLGLFGLIESFGEVEPEPWVQTVVSLEEGARRRRSLERRMRSARLGDFKPMADFDWSWPKKLDRDLVEEALRLDFFAEAANVILVGPNGVGKTMIAQNIAHLAVLSGRSVRMTTASALLVDLAAQDSTAGLMRRMRRYTNPALLLIDELGYLSSTAKHADLLFEVVTRRYQERRSIVLTTNKPFAEWGEVFPSAACVVTLVDRLIHRSEIIHLDGESYRKHESDKRLEQRSKKKPPEPTGAPVPRT
jgi:DNA replication protein DnaC